MRAPQSLGLVIRSLAEFVRVVAANDQVELSPKAAAE